MLSQTAFKSYLIHFTSLSLDLIQTFSLFCPLIRDARSESFAGTAGK